MRMNFTSLKVTQYMYIQGLARTPSKRRSLPKKCQQAWRSSSFDWSSCLRL